MKKTLSTLVLCVALASGSALAADLPSRKAAPLPNPGSDLFMDRSLCRRECWRRLGRVLPWRLAGLCPWRARSAIISSSRRCRRGSRNRLQGASSHNLDWFGTVRARLASPLSPNLHDLRTGGFAYARFAMAEQRQWLEHRQQCRTDGPLARRRVGLPANWSAKRISLHRPFRLNNGGWGTWVDRVTLSHTRFPSLEIILQHLCRGPIFAKY